jgi:hypothetical protein
VTPAHASKILLPLWLTSAYQDKNVVHGKAKKHLDRLSQQATIEWSASMRRPSPVKANVVASGQQA